MKEVFLVLGKRTPQVKSGMDLKEYPVPYLGAPILRNLLDETGIPNEAVDEVVVGNTGAPAKYPNIGRVIALEAGLDKSIDAYTVHRNCASGMEALAQGWMKISSGRCDIVCAGGVESMSQMPLTFSKEMTDLFIDLMKSKTVSDKIKVATQFRFPYLSPVVAIEQGLTDPFCGLNMGQTAEVLAREFGIDRETQDKFANESHHKTIKAQEEGLLKDEILPIYTGEWAKKILDRDIGPRANSTIESLAKLKPYFEKESGTVTVGNSCPITDGGSMFVMASAAAVEKYQLEPMARMHNFHFHGLEPERMGMGPLLAMNGVLKRTGRNIEEMDLVEINEAFAAQVLAVLEAMKNPEKAKRFGLDQEPGEIPLEKLNVNGGGIALGHPVGSTGCRIVVTLAHALKQRKQKYGLASLCIGGGQGGACLIENLG